MIENSNSKTVHPDDTGDHAIERYFNANVPRFGSIDIFLLGSGGRGLRIVQLMRALLVQDQSSSLFRHLVIVLPPTDQDTADARDQLKVDIETNLHENAGNGRDSQSRSVSSSTFNIVNSPDYNTQSLLAILRAADPQTAVVIVDAAEYRSKSAASSPPVERQFFRLQEDFWVPQLYKLAKAARELVDGTGLYVVLDAGKLTPRRQTNLNLLQSVDCCGLLGLAIDADPESILASRIADWNAWLASGRLGAVLQDIDRFPDASPTEKAFLRIQSFHRAGLHGQALAELENVLLAVEEAHPPVLVKLAWIAEEAGSSRVAAKLLKPAVERLGSFEILELALATADEIQDSELQGRISARLASLFPHSPCLARHRAAEMVLNRKYRDAGEMLEGVPGCAELADLYTALAEFLSLKEAPDYISAIEQAASLMPAQEARARMICVRDALSRGLLMHALSLALDADMSGDTARGAARQLLDVCEGIFLASQTADGALIHTEELKRAILKVVDYLSSNLADGRTRLRFGNLLSVQLSGSLGLALIASAAIDLSRRMAPCRNEDIPKGCSVEKLLDRKPFLDSAFAWLASESPIIYGRSVLPEELMTEPADEIVPAIVQALGLFGETLQSDDDVAILLGWLALGTALVAHTTDQVDDISMMRVAACRLAMAGRAQAARDLAEQVLEQAGQRPRRARLAWFAVADIYHTGRNLMESLISVACGFASNGEVNREEALHEAIALVCLLRDIGFFDLAREGLGSCRAFVRRLGISGHYLVRLETLELQINLFEFLEDSERSCESLTRLQRASVANARKIIAQGDDPAPVAAVLGELLRIAADSGLSPESEVKETLTALLNGAGRASTSLVELSSLAHPTSADVLAFLEKQEIARYSEDVGFDVQRTVRLARRLLADQSEVSDPADAVFAIELLSDRAIALPGWELTASPASKPATIEAPSSIAKTISLAGVSIVMAGLDAKSRLVRVAVADGKLGCVVREDETLFSGERLKSWAEEFPYRYGADDGTLNIFYTSTEGLELSGLPEGRVVLVAGTELQRLPPNLLRVQGQFAGLSRPMASVPSLSWLAAARERNTSGNGRLSAWISSGGNDRQTLGMIADRLGPTFDEYGIHLDRSTDLPEGMGGSDLAVIAAHGGIVPEGRYFQRVSDDAELRARASHLAGSLRNVGTVILFVCSGGRADKHPLSNTIVGLAKELLDRGCSAVVASPWPLDARVTYHWLPEFLSCWNKGAILIDANYAANKAVALGLGDDPSVCLAMSVYGDPLRTKRS